MVSRNQNDVMSSPKVSVLTPVFRTNHVYLKSMIESMLAQSFDDFEFLILNDSPDDKTLRPIIESYSDRRIRYLENEKNCGISVSRNRLIQEANGEYLAVLDHDDICLSSRLAKQVEYLDAHPEVGIVSGFVEVMSTGRVNSKRYPENNLAIKRRLLEENCVAHSAMMIRKSVLESTGVRYEAEFSPAEDYGLCVALMSYTLFHNLQEPLIRYRDHEGNTTNAMADLMEDRKRVVASIARRDFGAYIDKRKSDWLLFGFLKIGTTRKMHSGKMFNLFGIIPLILCR